ncbi:MAG: phenylalanyl-tRNA synthetase beta chain [Chloroflexi bacterium]|nr:MAG: phenylalanyl-tRNA synthetase beta chain [Chloroflexota bacterium]
MLVPLSWLKKYVEIDLPPKQIAHMLTMAGVEVSNYKEIGAHLDDNKFIVGEIIKIEPHPNADRIKLPMVDIGSQNTVQVVCGAPNIREGQKIAFAKIGAKVFNTHSEKVEQLREANIRGVKSEGMICSIKELGIGDDHEGILVLDDSTEVGIPISNVVSDVIFNIDVTPNRADCLSILGVAREIAALTNKTVLEPEISFSTIDKLTKSVISVDIKDLDLCRRYTASVIEGVTIKQSPQWLQDILIKIGQRPINNVVDITNYVMLETNQPLHAFDITSINNRSIIVRKAKSKEKLTTLDGEDRELEPPMLVIADTSGAIGLAGIMGGANSEISDSTHTILLEAANFEPINTRKTSSHLRLSTAASYRFERTLSPELAEIGLRRATRLIKQIAGGEVYDQIIDVGSKASDAQLIPFDKTRFNQVLGSEITYEDAIKTLESLGFIKNNSQNRDMNLFDTIEPSLEDTTYFTPPYWRPEIDIQEDLIEEVARITGYNAIPTTMISAPIPHHRPKSMWHFKEQIKDKISALGMDEIITYNVNSELELVNTNSWDIDNPPLSLANPMINDQRFLRSSLVANMLKTVSMNKKLSRDEPLRLFELGRIFIPNSNKDKLSLPIEKESLVSAFCGNRNARNWSYKPVQMNFYDAKGVLQSLLNEFGLEVEFKDKQDVLYIDGRAATVVHEGQIIGDIGELNPEVLKNFDLESSLTTIFRLDIHQLHNLVGSQDKTYEQFSKYPESSRDLSLIVDKDLLADQIEDVFKKHKYVKDIFPFDIYIDESLGTNKKSVTFQIIFQSQKGTLTAEQIDRCMEDLLNKLQRSMKVELRQG